MRILSNLRRRFQDQERRERRKTHVVEVAQSSRNSQTLPVPDTTFLRQKDNEALAPVADSDQQNCTNLPSQSSQNNRELELEQFRQEIDKWKGWKRDHPDQNWIRTVKDIADEKSPFLEMLPDGKIPIRGLVKSLIYTCKKAADFSLAKEEVYLFVQEVDGWLDIVFSAFNSGDKIGSDAWKVLDEIRQLIRAALDWSSKLPPSKWLSVQSQIQVYRMEFSEISRRFGLIFGIRLAEDLNVVKHNVSQIMENGNTAKRLELLKKQLESRLIENESYNDQEKHPCDPDTRLGILREIKSWINDVSESSQCFYWLSGAPGVGKSAITASVAKNCRDLGILGAQFFINRDDATTTDPRTLFPTICWRLCERFPRTVAVVMEEALRAQPTLVDDISEDQTSKLFVEAINLAAATDLSQAVVIVIDALDETDTKRLGYLAQMFSKVVTDLPRNAKVFISSRTEDAVTKPFNPLCSHDRVKSRHLKATDSVDEVSRYMEKEIKKILQDNEMSWDDWGDDTMRTLSSQAAGLFIWAKTALNFLRDEIEDKGKACFAGLLNVLKTDGMSDINTLYLAILQRKCKPGEWEYQRFRRIIGAILVRQTPLSIADITQLLDLKERSNSQPVDLVHFVRQYRTVLVDNTGVIHDHLVPRMHKSFADFVTSERAKEFRVDKSASHGELALRCIDQFSDLIKYLNLDEETQVSFPSQLVYVSQHWQSHLTRIIEPDMDNDAEEEKEYDLPDIPEHDTQSLPANSPDMKPDAAETERVTWVRFAFSPDGTRIASSDGMAIYIRDATTGSVIMFLSGHGNNVLSIGFSPDGTRLVSTALDETARIWDVQTGRELHVFRDTTNYATFSHDGKTLVTGSDDWTLHTWDTNTGQSLNVFKGHTNLTLHCTFSQNDQRIASRSPYEIMIWDVNLGNLISKIDDTDCHMISFCPCGNHLMSCDIDGEIKLWDAESGNQLDHSSFTIAQLTFLEESVLVKCAAVT